MNKLGRSAAAVAGVAVGMVMVTAPLATADSSGDLYVSGSRLASGGFVSNDEIFWSVDQKKDGKAVAVNWTASSKGGRYFTCWNTKSAAGGAKSCDDEIAEGARVSWRVCTGDYSARKLLNCSAWRTDYA